MRNPQRIDDILEQLRIYWAANPDLRFSQLFNNMASYMVEKNKTVLYFEDDDFYLALKELNKVAPDSNIEEDALNDQAWVDNYKEEGKVAWHQIISDMNKFTEKRKDYYEGMNNSIKNLKKDQE